MKKLLFILFLIIVSCGTIYTQDITDKEIPYIIDDFRLNVNYKDNPINLQKGEAADARNICTDYNNTLRSRLGYSVSSLDLPQTGKLHLIYEYKDYDGQKWLIVQISSNIYATTKSDWVTIKTGVSEIYNGNAITYLGEFWYTNGFDDVFSWNGATVTTYGFIPQGRYIKVHDNVLVLANTPENYSEIHFCTNWQYTKSPEGWPYQPIIVDEDRGDIITGIYSAPEGLLILKENSTWIMGSTSYGYEAPLKLFKNYGCISNGSISDYKNDTVYLTKDGLIKYSKGGMEKIDKDIEILTKNATLNNATVIGKSWLQDNDNDFMLGESSQSIVIANDNVSLYSSEVKTYNTSEKINPDNIDERWEPQFYQNDSSRWCRVDSNLLYISENNGNNKYTIDNVNIKLARSQASVYSSSITIIATIECSTYTVIYGNTKWIDDLGTGNWYTFFDTFTIVSHSGHLYFDIYGSTDANATINLGCWYDKKSSYIYYNDIYTEFTFKAGEMNLYLTKKEEMINDGWDEISFKYWNGTANTYFTSRWHKQVEKNSDYISYPMLKYDYVVNPSTWGYIISQKHDVGTDIYTWKHFLAAWYGDIDFAVKIATSSDKLDTASWTSINNGDLISATISQHWIQWKATLNNSNAVLDSVMVRWFEGSDTNYDDICSINYNNNYMLFFSTSGTSNNLVAVYDDNGEMTIWNNINASAVGIYNNILKFGNDDGHLYNLLTYTSYHDDEGTAINSYWESPLLDFGEPYKNKYLKKLGCTYKGLGDFDIYYKSDTESVYTSSITFTAFSTTTCNNLINLPIGMSSAKYWSIKIIQNTVGKWFEIPSVSLYYLLDEKFQR